MEAKTEKTMIQLLLSFIIVVLVIVLIVIGVALCSVSNPPDNSVKRVDELLMHTNYRVDILTDRVSRIEARLPRTGSPTGDKKQ